MSRLPRRPTRRQSAKAASTLSLIFFALLALILLCPVSVNADVDEDKKAEYGTVIGIGVYSLHLLVLWSVV